MAGYINKVTLMGHVGAEPRIATMPDGREVANLRLATSERYTKGDERIEKTEWHTVAVFNSALVGVIKKMVAKGTHIMIEDAALETRKWQDSEGKDRYTTEVVLRPYAGEIHVLGKAKTAEAPAEPQGAEG